MFEWSDHLKKSTKSEVDELLKYMDIFYQKLEIPATEIEKIYEILETITEIRDSSMMMEISILEVQEKVRN